MLIFKYRIPVLLLACLSLLQLSCKDNTLEYIDSGDWNNERSIINIMFENQVGVATVKRDQDNNGEISFMLNEQNVSIDQLKITDMEISVGSQSNVKVGEVLNFNNKDKTAHIIITSKTGIQKEWKITYVPFKDDLIGTWKITKMSLYGGFWPQWGGAALFPNLVDRPWDWRDNGTGPVAEYDNTFTFALDGVDENGNAFGTLVNDAGTDKLFADFYFVDDNNNLNVNNLYRKIPVGTSKWKRDAAKGTIIFTDKDGKTSTAVWLNKTVEKLVGEQGDLLLEVPDYAFRFDYVPTQIWIDIYKDREKVVENLKNYWIQIKKTN
ncbi:hypothetical protein LZQ00_03915 [Sphingobacterium sp. SRCM116780]|uniref:hypothetical protein n=1 Tax=Sphingobacterium sp. SRCM116780 TaxID=2907623 RepID=UPI001F41B4F2|nr:hypothetical protein [Sphingobacterium sp. SRCM116780]UIR56967.1 hypothetical protein LZQ00_03915 [Sphingobacterium sp. SRCM116780]